MPYQLLYPCEKGGFIPWFIPISNGEIYEIPPTNHNSHRNPICVCWIPLIVHRFRLDPYPKSTHPCSYFCWCDPHFVDGWMSLDFFPLSPYTSMILLVKSANLWLVKPYICWVSIVSSIFPPNQYQRRWCHFVWTTPGRIRTQSYLVGALEHLFIFPNQNLNWLHIFFGWLNHQKLHQIIHPHQSHGRPRKSIESQPTRTFFKVWRQNSTAPQLNCGRFRSARSVECAECSVLEAGSDGQSEREAENPWISCKHGGVEWFFSVFSWF